MKFNRMIVSRYLQSNRENRFFSWITILSILGLAIGVTALIVVLSVINGFESELRRQFLHANAHIMAYRYPQGVAEPEKWIKIIRRDFENDVRGVSPFIHYETMAKSNAIMRAVLVRGISPKLRESVQSAEGLLRPANAADALQKEVESGQVSAIPPVIIGNGLKNILDVEVGDVTELISPTEGRYSETKKFKVVGVYSSGLKHYDNRLILMSLNAAQDFFNMGELVTGLEIGLHNPDKSQLVTDKMDEKYKMSFREWQTYNRPLFEALERERNVISIIVAFVVIVAAFNILTTIFVSVSQKQRDISIMKAVGATNGQILKLFVTQGIAIGIIGSILGAVLALGASWILDTFPIIDLPDPYYLSSLPVTYNPLTYLAVCGAAVIICIVASLYPAFLASKVTPTDGFRGVVAA